jgi:hypothetical protein
MKPSNKILMLTLTVTCIVLFWLAPGINKSTATKYTRVFENTDVKKSVDHSDTIKTTTSKKEKVSKNEEKIYRKESIKANARWKDLKPRMFSRAIHFNEEVLMDSVPVVTTFTNSTESVSIDSLAKR